DNDIDKFVGTWQSVIESDTFTIEFVKLLRQKIDPVKWYMDYAAGYHTFSGDGVYESSFGTSNYSVLFGRTFESSSKLQFSFKDLTKDKHSDATLELLDPTGRVRVGSQARFRLGLGERIIINGMEFGKPYQKGHTVPTDVIMTKVE
ncbi:MAG: hypothetical protein RIF46_17145, partial [Cyclobacteriaceae bacterium]